ncbi:MAG: hypothetical protein PHV95_09155 [Eubacteriales bacterium]|nr:hypothetical protein [Eubacteriales bacterium]MDD4475935.1 hypothetical protein [Eubacteriales bacterium]
MGKRVLIKEASETVGLSEWELRQGIRSGRYPAMKVGTGKGKYIIDIDLLEARIRELMQANVVDSEKDNQNTYGRIRRIQ